MKTQQTRILSLVLALALVLSSIGMVQPATATEETTTPVETTAPEETQPKTEPETTMPELTLGVSTDAVISEGGEIAYFTFTPEESGMYIFYSEAALDTYGYLYDAEMNWLSEDDDGGETTNFSISYQLEAGTTYIFGARYYSSGNTGTFPVRLELSPIVSITANPISLVEGTCGYWSYTWDSEVNANVPYQYYYTWYQSVSYTITFRDGSTQTATGTPFVHNGISYEIQSSDSQAYGTQWTPGNTYNATMSIGAASADLTVTIVDNPIAAIAVDPVSVCEGINGYYDGDYFRYTWGSNLSYTVTMDDGSTLSGTGTSFTYGGDTYELAWWDTQSSSNPWQPDSTYSAEVSLGSLTVPVEVNTFASPVESITIEPYSLKPYSNGYEVQEEIDGQTVRYFYYRTWDLDLCYTVTFRDGTVVSSTGPNVFYNGSDHSIEISENQSYQNQWLPGNTYTLNASVLGADCTVQLTIEEIPFESIVADPITVWGDLDADARSDTDDSGEYHNWLCYRWLHKLSYTVTYRDGTTQRLTGTSFSYDGESYYLDSSHSQSWDNPWQIGCTYTENLSVSGLTIPVSITVAEPAVEDVVIQPVTMTIGLDSETAVGTDPETGESVSYPYYDWYSGVAYTIHFTDGTTMDCSGTYFEYEGITYDVGRMDGQEDPYAWNSAGDYPVGLNIGEKWYETTVTLNPSPVASVEVAPLTVNEGIHGELRSGENGSYFYYEWWNKLTYTVTFHDGTVVEGTDTSFEYQGDWYTISKSDSQNADAPWSVGSTYTAQINIMGIPADVTVVVEENPVDHVEVDPIHIPEGTNGYTTSGYNSVTGQYESYYRYRWWYHLSCTIFFKDGTSLRTSDTSFFYDSAYCSVSYTDPQSASNPMLVGNIYLCTISLLGVDAEVEISINASATEGRYNYMITDSGVIITGITSSLTGEVLELPDTLGGQNVVGILSLGSALHNASEIIIPDSVTMLSASVFDYWYAPLQRLHLGSGISYIDFEMLSSASQLESITVSEDNPHYCSIDGVVYDKDVTTLIVYPLGKTDAHKVPDTVTDVSAVLERLSRYESLNLELGDGVTDYVSEDGVIYNADKTKVYYCSPSKTGTYIMPDTVTEISRSAFSGSNLTEITVSANVTQIVYGTFYGSTKLEKVNLPDKLESIGLYAFQNCSSLKSADIPASVTSIDHNAYAGCERLEAVNIKDLAAWSQIDFNSIASNPLSIARDLYLSGQLITDLVLPDTGTTKISAYAFYNGSMTSAVIPGSIKAVYGRAFENSDLETLTLAEGTETIWTYAFANTKIDAVVLPDSLTTLGGAAFLNCTQLQSATIGSGLTEIGGSAFKNTALQRITIPENVTYIGWAAFRDSKLTEVVFENDAVEISGYAFANCPLKEINLGDQVSIIDESAFCGSHAAMVKIPASVTDITYRSFAFSPNLMGVVIPAGVEYINVNAFEGDMNLSHVLYCGTDEQWSALSVDSPELLSATLHCGAVGDELTVTESCAQIKLYCSICQRSQWINKVSPEHDFVDGVCAVCGHEGYWEYEIDTAAKTVTVTGYSGPDTAITIPSTIRNMPVTAIADNAFYGRKDLTAISIPSTVTTIGSKAFAQCESLTRMILPNSVTKLGSYAFAYCYNLTNVTLSESLTEIDDYTFMRCLELTELRIPASVTSLGAQILQSAWSLDKLTFCADAPAFDENAFAQCYPTCYYPASNTTWTADVMQDYGGSPTWVGLNVIPPVLSAQGFTLSFEDEILVNFYFQVDDTQNTEEIGMAVFYSDPGSEIDVTAADECYENAIFDEANNRYMCQTDGIASKEMGDDRFYIAYAKLTDGSYAYSPVYQYSPKQYAMGRLEKSSNANLKALCVAMLNYGAAAQSYFNYNEGNLMNESLTAEQKALVADYSADLFVGAVSADSSKIGNFAKSETGFLSRSASVSFEGAFSINYYFTPDSTVDGTMTFYYWTSEDYAAAEKLSPSNATGSFTVADQGNGTYWAQIEGIAAKALDKTYYVAAVYYSELELKCTGIIAYSLSRYCMNNAKEGKDMQELAANTAMYGYYAKLYFA